jgi:uncharacterized SAM-binding protein YcdF (DUF218 family)
VVHEQNARDNACYVLAGGKAIQERLDAAADLVRMGRISKIILMRDNTLSRFSLKINTHITKSQWAMAYLAWRGVSPDKISWVRQTDGFFGTLTEAKAVAKILPRDLKRLVVISSAPHMCRALLAFKRSLPADVIVVPYAATSFENSYEMHHPIWIEYLKLLVYFIIA